MQIKMHASKFIVDARSGGTEGQSQTSIQSHEITPLTAECFDGSHQT